MGQSVSVIVDQIKNEECKKHVVQFVKSITPLLPSFERATEQDWSDLKRCVRNAVHAAFESPCNDDIFHLYELAAKVQQSRPEQFGTEPLNLRLHSPSRAV